jgi:HPt (histidine-containing phosphotransfer) domain-containing protein
MDPTTPARLATLLGCSPQGLPDLRSLDSVELEQLCQAIEQSLGHHDQAMAASLPEFLRPLLAMLRSRA